MINLLECKWRVGRSVGRTIYAIVENSSIYNDDILIGMMDTPELARSAVEDHNRCLGE